MSAYLDSLLPTEDKKRNYINKLFKGRLITNVEVLGLNSWKFHFMDGGNVTIDTMAMGHGIHGPDICEVTP